MLATACAVRDAGLDCCHVDGAPFVTAMRGARALRK